jgi:hypothetical protein
VWPLLTKRARPTAAMGEHQVPECQRTEMRPVPTLLGETKPKAVDLHLNKCWAARGEAISAWCAKTYKLITTATKAKPF